jgi:hypothetical protein
MSPKVTGRVPEKDPLIVRLIRELAFEFGGEVDLDDPDTEEAMAIYLAPRITVVEEALKEIPRK